MKVALGIDTSCYTTSAACFGGAEVLFDGRKLLPVEKGQRGLRQSEGLYHHVRQLPAIIDSLFAAIEPHTPMALGVSTQPVQGDASYMPVFLAGSAMAKGIAAALHIPLIPLDHQSGHIRAALIGNEELFKQQGFYAMHISGGTSDMLWVEPHKEKNYTVRLLGKGNDIHAGQLVDRVGVALGCSFPSGKELEALALQAVHKNVRIPSSVRGLEFSLSGGETAALRLLEQGSEPPELAFGIYDLLARSLSKLFKNALNTHGEAPVLICGGVASSLLLRELLKERCTLPLYFGESRYSSDNAVGIAALCWDRMEAGLWS